MGKVGAQGGVGIEAQGSWYLGHNLHGHGQRRQGCEDILRKL